MDLLASHMGLDGATFPDDFPGKAGKRRLQGALHALEVRTAAIEQFQPGCRNEIPVLVIEFFRLELFCHAFTAQTRDRVRLPGAKFLYKAAVRIIPFIVDQAADGIQQIVFLTFKITGNEASPLCSRVADQLAQQGSHRLQQFFSTGSEAIVDQACNKANALILAFFAHSIVDTGAIESVQVGSHASHIREGNRAAAKNGAQQRIGRGSLFPQGNDKLGREQAGLKFAGPQIGEVHALCKLFANDFHGFSSFGKCNGRYTYQYTSRCLN